VLTVLIFTRDVDPLFFEPTIQVLTDDDFAHSDHTDHLLYALLLVKESIARAFRRSWRTVVTFNHADTRGFLRTATAALIFFEFHFFLPPFFLPLNLPRQYCTAHPLA